MVSGNIQIKLSFFVVCGSDGLTHSNNCEFESYKCKTQQWNLTVLHKSPCFQWGVDPIVDQPVSIQPVADLPQPTNDQTRSSGFETVYQAPKENLFTNYQNIFHNLRIY